MSDDLVERLRDFDPHQHEWEVVDEAADRIELLTAERDQWIAHAKNAVWADSEELKLAEADNTRLREAIVFWLEAQEPDVDAAINIMRAALKGEAT